MGQSAFVLPNSDLISDQEYERLRQLIRDVCGVSLGDEKKSLVVGRLHAVLQREGFPTFDAYYNKLKSDRSGRLMSELVDRISTNHTFFNRENTHFDMLRTRVLPEAIARRTAARQRKLRIWCAASSYGQEPYTLAMITMDVLGMNYSKWDAGILATDINTEVLAKAEEGVYDGRDIAQLPDDLRKRYFDPVSGEQWRAKDKLRKEVLFRRFNLMNTKLPFKEPFDVIFCRNVMIYFDVDVKAALGERFYRNMHPGAYLFLGAAESLPRGHKFRQVAPIVYKKDA